MSGHGWVVPRPDGQKARCGGPAICSDCQAEQEEVRRQIENLGKARPVNEYEKRIEELERENRLFREATEKLFVFLQTWPSSVPKECRDLYADAMGVSRDLPYTTGTS